jgi:hypothetical protein
VLGEVVGGPVTPAKAKPTMVVLPARIKASAILLVRMMILQSKGSSYFTTDS